MISLGSTTNLHKHMQTEIHLKEYTDYKKSLDNTPSRNIKRRKIDFDASPNTPNKAFDFSSFQCFSSHKKYKTNSVTQHERLLKLTSMIVKCMIPISIVESEGFIEYIKYLDPSFSMPTRPTIKKTALPEMKLMVQNKIKAIINTIQSVSTSMDAWTDAAARPFNGFIVQGIDNQWQLHTLPVEFEYIEG